MKSESPNLRPLIPAIPGGRSRRRLLLLALLAGSGSSAAGSDPLPPPTIGTSELYAADLRSGLALFGIDPVSYWTEPRPRPGRPDREILWAGLAWRFAGTANLEAFRRDPDGFAPRLGGYDAEAVAAGRLVPPDPGLFVLRSGRLYLFRTEAARSRFLADPAREEAAESRWPALEATLVRG